jgi:hypothetical protein
MKATISTINVPNVSWKKYVVKKGGAVISQVFYYKKEAQEFRDQINKTFNH